MLPGLQRMEGYDYNAIGFIFDIHEIEQERRRELFSGITNLINVISAERRERAEKK